MLAEFYKDCEIFMTGGSGVVGKAAIEKLLRSCDVKKIYILLRCKKGYSVDQRLEKIKSAKIFRVLKTQKPNELNKLVAIPGDAILPNLGITPHYEKVLENVSIFFHCAATVRFNDPLKHAIKVNVGGTWEALKFAETLKNLKIYVHVSTFFSNPYLESVESKMYSSPMDWKLCLQMVENETGNELFDTLTKKIVVGFPNTYCFTKNLAESVVNEYRSRLPVVIFRPSIVFSALSEPEPGFPPSLMGATGVFVLMGAGLLKAINARSDVFLDMISQDLSTVAMLTYAYMAAKKYEQGNVVDVPVTLASSYNIFHYTFKESADVLEKNDIWNEFIFDKNFLIPGFYIISSRYLYKFVCFTHEIFPALLVDSLLILFRRKPILMSVARKKYTTLEILKPFLFNNYKSDMVDKLPELLQVTNGTDFDFSDTLKRTQSVEGLNDICRNQIFKIREVLLNEDPSTLPRARRILKVKIVLYNVIRGCLLYYVLRWSYKILSKYFSL